MTSPTEIVLAAAAVMGSFGVIAGFLVKYQLGDIIAAARRVPQAGWFVKMETLADTVIADHVRTDEHSRRLDRLEK